MPTNVSYANTDSILESLVLHTLPDFGEHGDGIINVNLLLAALREKKRFREVEGGLEFWKGLLKAENTNFKWQAHTDTMNANLQDPVERLRFAIKTFTGSIVINKLHEAQNKGRAMIKNFAQTLRDQAESTIPNQFNSAFWNTAPGANEPESVPSIISSTPTTGTIGGLSRTGRPELQNGASTAVFAIGAQAGITALKQLQIKQAVTSNDMIDLIIMTDTLYGSLVGYLSTLNRYRPDERMAKLDFDTINLGNTLIGFENTNVKGGANTMGAGTLYGINSKHFLFEVLKDGNFIWNPDGFERVPLTLNKALYFWVFCNITTNLPRAHLVATNVTP
jgi:hypothetical protein